MEDIFKFLVVAGAIAFGIFRQVSKEKARKSESKKPLPEPEFNEYEPEKPVIFEIPEVKPHTAKPINRKPLLDKGTRTTNASIPPPKKAIPRDTDENDESEYSIRTAEEARRAVIWSEIIRRKY